MTDTPTPDTPDTPVDNVSGTSGPTDLSPGDLVDLHHGEMERVGLVLATSPDHVTVEVNGPRARTIVMPASKVSARGQTWWVKAHERRFAGGQA